MQEEQVLNLIRYLRHDFGNCLQVIHSCIEVERPQDSQTFIKQWVEEMKNDKIIFSLSDAKLAVHLFQTKILAHDLGVRVIYDEIQTGVSTSCIVHDEPFTALCKFAEGGWRDLDDPVVHIKLIKTGVQVLISFVLEGSDRAPQEYYIKES